MEIRKPTISEAWEHSIRELLQCDQWIPTERGMRALELRNLLIQIDRPTQEPQVSSSYAFSEDFINAYCASFRQYFPSASIKERLFKYGSTQLNQLQIIQDKLTSCWFSRRAVVTFWEPDVDLYSAHPPCPTSMQFVVRNDKLHLTVTLRSNDAWMSAVPDFLSFVAMQLEMAAALDLEVGTYAHHAVSYHLYEPDLLAARKAFE